MAIFSVACLVIKRDGLQFHTRDYNYFIEQAARLTDPHLSKRFALNIEGYNMLGMQGIEGADSLIQAIHAEYFRYTYVILYGIFHTTLSIYIFYSLIYFLPLLYFALITHSRSSDDKKMVALFILLFILFPATIPSVTADLRPRMLFTSAWCLIALAIYYDRPFFEKLILFGLLIGIREEGILLGAIVLAFNFTYMTGKPNRWKQTLVFITLDAIAFGLFLAFMAWGKYQHIETDMDPRNVLSGLFSSHLGLILGVAALIILVTVWTWLRRRQNFTPLVTLLVYGAAILVTGVQALRDATQWYALQSALGPVSLWDIYIHMVTTPATALVYYITLLLLVILLGKLRGKSRSLLTGGLLALSIVFAVTTLITIPPQITQWRQATHSAQIVCDFVDHHDRYQDNVLLDYSTYQAFYNYENILVYNRLPLWLVLPEFRLYPENKEILVKQIQKRMEYVVISTDSMETVNELVRLAGKTAIPVNANDQYVILKLR